jgi:two-component system response regulator YesN
MYKLMVVDDEQIVIDAVNFIVKNHIANVSVCVSARSGGAAVELIAQHKPDIVLMDICMPGMNGLDAISQMKRIAPSTRFVIISAYEQFEFAKQAVELEVKEYLLKPVNKERLIEAIQRITSELDAEQMRVKQNLETQEKYEQALRVLEHGLIYSILINRDPAQELMQYRELVGISDQRGYIMILRYDHGEHKRRLSDIRRSIEEEQFFIVFRDILKIRRHCLIGPAMPDRTVVYIFSRQDDEYASRVRSIGFAEEIMREIRKVSDMTFAIGIGSVKSDSEIAYSYEEALRALRESDGDNIVHISDISQKRDDEEHSVIHGERQLLNALELGDTQKADRILYDIFKRVDTKELCSSAGSKLRNKFVELIVIAHRIAMDLDVQEDMYLNYNGYLNEVQQITDPGAFEAWYKNRITYIAMKIKETREMTTSKIISDAKRYIEENYAQEISLDALSRELGISPQYFSKLFKKEVGVNFIEYLTQLRLKKAKEIMKDGGKSIKEICYMVGYTDPNYFSRIFRKHTDLSPTEYIKGV